MLNSGEISHELSQNNFDSSEEGSQVIENNEQILQSDQHIEDAIVLQPLQGQFQHQEEGALEAFERDHKRKDSNPFEELKEEDDEKLISQFISVGNVSLGGTFSQKGGSFKANKRESQLTQSVGRNSDKNPNNQGGSGGGPSPSTQHVGAQDSSSLFVVSQNDDNGSPMSHHQNTKTQRSNPLDFENVYQTRENQKKRVKTQRPEEKKIDFRRSQEDIFERDEEQTEDFRKAIVKESENMSRNPTPKKSTGSSPEPQIENIGIDGSQRFSDIQNENLIGGLNNNSESMIVFNPKKEIKNPNLFSQVMTSTENQKFKEMLGQTKNLSKENAKLREENRIQKELIQNLLDNKTLSTLDSELEEQSQNLTNKLYAQKQYLRQTRENNENLNSSQISLDSNDIFICKKCDEWQKEKSDLQMKQFQLMNQLNILKSEFQKVMESKKDENQEIEKVLQPILEQINDETEGLLLQDLKQRWFKISLCSQEEIDEQQRLEDDDEDKNNNSV